MSNYVRNFTETFDFDGDSITVSLKQLKRIHAMELMPAMSGMQGLDPTKPETMTADKITKGNEFMNVAAKVIKDGDYVISLSGLTIEGRQVVLNSSEWDEVLNEFYFSGLVATIAGLLVKHSSLSKADEKKSDAQSESKEFPQLVDTESSDSQ